MHRIGPCKFIPAVSHAIIIKWRTVIFYYGSGIWLSELNRNLTTIVVICKNLNDKKSCQNMIENGDEHLPLLNRLKEYRSRLGINQTEMGKLAGVSRQTISQIERGDYSPSVTLALKIAKICEVSVEDIFIYEEEINDEGKEK